MAFVKSESFLKGVCSGCLSMDRDTSPIKHHDLFMMLLTKQNSQEETKCLTVRLCWECKAILYKISQFQERISEAQFILENSLHLDQNTFLSTTISLSTLNTVHMPEYDYILNYDEVKKKRDKLKSKVQGTPIKDVIKEEVDDEVNSELNHDEGTNDYDSNDLANDYDNNDGAPNDFDHNDDAANIYENNDDENAHVKKECTDKEERKQTNYRRYQHHAVVTKQELDLEKPEKHYLEVTLTNDEMFEIVRKVKGSRKDSSKLKVKCLKCRARFRKLLDLKRHIDIDHLESKPPYPCSECAEEFPTVAKLHEHWQTHNIVYKCTMCGQLCQGNYEIRYHLKTHHSRLYTCRDCGYQCQSSFHFANHFRDLHTQYICDNCGKVCKSKENVEKHIRKYHVPSYCQICNRLFSKYHGLEVHYKNFHPELVYKSFKRELSYCVECDKQFPSQYIYKRHLSTAAAHVQKKVVKIPCPECGKIFSRKTYMKNHYKLVHVRQSKHYCSICNKHFISGFSLRTHTKFVHEKTVKPKDKICDVCGRGFHTNRTLINHTRTHTGERPYKCSFCPAAFAQSYARKTHERSQHKNMTDVYMLQS
ncbi:unnamed protein product [Leptosia nina]|uniref:C2H2-type domain-containing protein n=1 Tax=Leptosia nina TaxID=320188 RepID=A0AAV1JV33_9NEOP